MNSLLFLTVFQEGGFYSAEDADSLPTAESKEKKEGAFCAWTWAELQSLLAGKVSTEDGPTLAEVFCHHYSCREEGNVDPLQVCQDGLLGGRDRMSMSVCVCVCVCVCVYEDAVVLHSCVSVCVHT